MKFWNSVGIICFGSISMYDRSENKSFPLIIIVKFDLNQTGYDNSNYLKHGPISDF